MTKVCSSCKEEKLESEFASRGLDSKGERTTRSICKKCANKIREEKRKNNPSDSRKESDKRRHKEYREKNREKLQWKCLENEYGVTQEKYLQMLEGQGGGCAICEEKPNGKKLAVDHCHTTNKVRGLLCHRCNTSLGLMRDSPTLLAKATSYLLTNSVFISPTFDNCFE